MKKWRVPFLYEKGGLMGHMDVRARHEWRAHMAVQKILRRRGWRPFLIGSTILLGETKRDEANPTKPANGKTK